MPDTRAVIPLDEYMQPSWEERFKSSIDGIRSVLERGRGGLKTGFKRLDFALNGLQPGFHIIAAEANLGKSAFITQMAWQTAMNNPNVHVLDITLDDSMLEKVCRLAAHISGQAINTVKGLAQVRNSNPAAYQSIINAFDTIKTNAHHYQIMDNEQGGTLEKLREVITGVRTELLAREIPGRLAVFIDSFHDIIPDIETTNETTRFNYLAQAVAELANEFDIPIVCTAELRKLNGFRRPTLDDIRESVKIRYEAKSVLLCYNEVSVRDEQAQVYWYPSDDIAKYPVFEVHVAKNKFSSFKGRICFEFRPEVARFREPDDVTHRKYLDLIIQKTK